MSDHSSSDEHSSSCSDDHDDLVEDLVRALSDYTWRHYGNVKIEGLKETMENYPVEIIGEAIVQSNIMPYVLTHSEQITLDLVTYLVDLAPTAVRDRDREPDLDNDDCPPLHSACNNRNCPISVIKFLLERDPSSARHAFKSESGESSDGFPLHCYLRRAIKRCAWDEFDPMTDDLIYQHPEVPGQRLDYDTVEMLVQACPEALTATTNLGSYMGSPLIILCRGCSPSLDLARLLTDKEHKCFEEVEEEFPMRSLFQNHDFDAFPTDVFQYFMECCPSSLRIQKAIEDDDDSFNAINTDTLLQVACSNPKITAEVIQIIIDECPYMVKEEYAFDGILPLHTLCCNEGLDDESSMDILKILVNQFPESVRTNVAGATAFEWQYAETWKDDLPIHYACRYKSLDFCRYLIEKHPESVSKSQMSYNDMSLKLMGQGSLMLPFHLACKYGSLDLVQYLLEKYPVAIELQTSDSDYNHKYKRNYAYERNEIEVTESNASMLQKGNYPLHLAVFREDSPQKMEIVNFLLQQDTNAASKVGKYGNLPLHLACGDPAIKKLFELYPAAIETKNIFGQLPIHLAMRDLDESTFDGLSFLAHQRPESLSVLDERGMSCAHYACSSENSLEKLELIAELCPEAFRCQSESCGLPIHYACTSGSDEEVLEYLVAQYPESLGVHVGSLDSPLHCVVKCHESRLANESYPSHFSKELRFLIKEKYRTDVENGLPIVHAFLQDNEMQNKDRILACLPFSKDERAEEDERGRTLSHLIFRITKDVELIKRNVVYPKWQSKQDHDGWIPLHHAIRHGASLETVKFLSGWHLELQVADNRGRTPLHFACRYSHITFIKALLEADPELVRSTDSNGRTALNYACERGRSVRTIAFLLERNSDITAADENGDLPLHKACQRGDVPLVEFLMAKDMATIAVTNFSNELPVHALANRSGRDDVLLESTEYMGTIYKLLRAYPDTMLM